MRLIVTRPLEDAGPLAAKLGERGHEPVVEPLIGIAFRRDVSFVTEGVQAVVATSANGIRALERQDDAASLARLPLHAVGGASAAAARDAGFRTVISADGDLSALVAQIRAQVDPAAGRLLYVTGATVSGDLAGLLAADGFEVDRAVLYDAVPADRLSEAACDTVRMGGGVLLFSPRTAAVWARLVAAAGLEAEAGRLVHFCLSAAVADRIRAALAVPPERLKTAVHPDLDSMLALVEHET